MKKISAGLATAILFQFLVLCGMYVSAAMPMWTGKEIKVKTIPVDPRSMFRGNYALLEYEFTSIKTKKLEEEDYTLRNSEIIYVVLKKGKKDLHEFSEITLEKPVDKTYLRGRIEYRHYDYETKTNYFRIKYGIEAYFAPKEKALALEKELSKGGVAVLMVADDGRARLKSVEAN